MLVAATRKLPLAKAAAAAAGVRAAGPRRRGLAGWAAQLAAGPRAAKQAGWPIGAVSSCKMSTGARWLRELDSKTPEEQEVRLERDEPSKLARLCLRSGAKNALSGKMIAGLGEALDQLERWEGAKGLLVHGHGGNFCSGSDLVSARQTTLTEGLGHALAAQMQDNIMRLQRLPMLVVAYLEGYALGGGAELALAADMRVMAASARIGFVHVKMGICLGWGGGARLVQLLGPARALQLMTSGRLVGPEEALRLGLAEQVDCQSLEAAHQFLQKHTIGSHTTIAGFKEIVNTARSSPSVTETLKVEARLFGDTWGQPDHVAALDANFKHKK